MMDLPKISVIIPIYNTEKYVEKCVRSIMEQTYTNLEIICVNDGSTDSSLDILKRLQAEDNRIIIIDQPNAGLGEARNSGIVRASSEWLSFVDSDDSLVSNAYETVVPAFHFNPDMVYFGINPIIEEGVEIGLAHHTDEAYKVNYQGLHSLSEEMKKKLVIAAVWNKIFRKSIIEKYEIKFESIYYEDFAFSSQYYMVINNAYFIQDQLYNYLRRADSIMAETFSRTPRAIDHLRAMSYILSFANKYKLVEKHSNLLTTKFLISYFSVLYYGTKDIMEESAIYAAKLYNENSFLHDTITMSVKNRTLIFERKRNFRLSSIFEKIFSVKKEYVDYELYKVVRLFNVIIYKRKQYIAN